MGRIGRNSDHGSNVQAVRDWMQTKESVIDGVTVTNAEAVIYKYFGADIYNQVMADTENFYLVLEPTVTAQLGISKVDMRDDSIFAATTYGWGFIEMVYSGWGDVLIYKPKRIMWSQGLGRLVHMILFCLCSICLI